MAKNNTKINTKKIERIEYKDIISSKNQIIRQISMDVGYPLNKEDRKTMVQMIDYVRSSQDEVEAKERKLRSAFGISAIQIGIAKKLIYVRIENEFGLEAEEFALINPKILSTSTTKTYLSNGEGCLSVKEDHKGYVLRPHGVKILAIDYFTEREVEIDSRGITAIVLQHEMDHLLGILFYDRINKLNPYKLDPKEKIIKV